MLVQHITVFLYKYIQHSSLDIEVDIHALQYSYSHLYCGNSYCVVGYPVTARWSAAMVVYYRPTIAETDCYGLPGTSGSRVTLDLPFVGEAAGVAINGSMLQILKSKRENFLQVLYTRARLWMLLLYVLVREISVVQCWRRFIRLTTSCGSSGAS